MILNEELKSDKVFYFSYENSSQSVPDSPDLKIAIPCKTAKTQINLNINNFKKKKFLITSEYGFKEDSFEALCCGAIETFDNK